MEVCDAAKLLYQREFGCAHMLRNPEGARNALEEECVKGSVNNEPLVCDMGNGLVRINLCAAAENGIPADDVFD